ncbi:hypothetical protein Tco_0091423 [Tanacetum coccineum]
MKACIQCEEQHALVFISQYKDKSSVVKQHKTGVSNAQEGSKEWDDQRLLEEVEELLEEGMLSMEEEEVPLVDGVFEGTLGALGDESDAWVMGFWCHLELNPQTIVLVE